MCKQIVDILIHYIQRRVHLGTDEISILRYQTTVMLYEASEFLSVVVFAAIIGKLKEFVISYIVVILVRCRIGGIHHSSFIGCYIHTLFFFIIVISASSYIDCALPDYIYILCGVVDWLFSPFPSKNRGPIGKKTARRMKIAIYIGLLASYIVSLITPMYNNIILITLTMIHIELLVRCLRERRKPCLNGYVI